MEAVNTKSVPAAVDYAPHRPQNKQETVATTELPAPQSVVQVNDSDATGAANGKAMGPSADDVSFAEKIAETEPPTRREFDLDPETADLVFKTINEDTGEVIRQLPSEAILKVRAYARDDQSAHQSGPEEAETTRIDKEA